MDGRHTKDRIIGACIFLDNYTRYSHTHLQTSIDGDQTLEAKQGFEQHSTSFGVKIKTYHADNGIFAERSFRDEIKISEEQITFCGVRVHHQNGVVEKHIGILTLRTRTDLLHAQHRWSKINGTILCPFAWKNFERRYNHFFLNKEGLSTTNRYSYTTVRTDMRGIHSFGCPVFDLSSGLQNACSMIPKWDPRSRVRLYLEHPFSSILYLMMNFQYFHLWEMK